MKICPKGRWKKDDEGHYFCLKCGEEAIDLESEPDIWGHDYILTPFCPWCGTSLKSAKLID